MPIVWKELPSIRQDVWSQLEDFLDDLNVDTWPDASLCVENLVEMLRLDAFNADNVRNQLTLIRSECEKTQSPSLCSLWAGREKVIRESLKIPSGELLVNIGAAAVKGEVVDEVEAEHEVVTSVIPKVRVRLQYHTLGVVKAFALQESIDRSDYLRSLQSYLSTKEDGFILSTEEFMKSLAPGKEEFRQEMRSNFQSMCVRMQEESIFDQSQSIDEMMNLMDAGKVHEALEKLSDSQLAKEDELREAKKVWNESRTHSETLKKLLVSKNKMLPEGDTLYWANVVRLEFEKRGPQCKKKSDEASAKADSETFLQSLHENDKFEATVVYYLSKCQRLADKVHAGGDIRRLISKFLAKEASAISKRFSDGKASGKVIKSLLRSKDVAPTHRKDIEVLRKILQYELVHNGVIMPGSKLVTHNPFPVITQRSVQGVTDNSFDLDPLFDAMTISVEALEGSSFPKQWKLSDTENNVELIEEVLLVNRVIERGMPLSTFKNNILAKHPNLAIILEEVFSRQHIDSTDQLMAMTDEDLKVFRSASVGLALAVEKELERLVGKNASMRFLSDEATVHNIRRLIGHRCRDVHISDLGDTKMELEALPWLSPEAVKKALLMTKRKYYGEILLNQVVNDFYLPYTEERSPATKSVLDVDRGLLLHGPPGTGKSAINEYLPVCSGIVLVAPPMSSGELARPYVGQTEKAIKMFCERALLAPWLLFGWVVDETDSMAPKRTASGEDKNASKLATFLSVVGGSGNVPNIVILGGTNRLESMDEAVLRRLSGQFYVGRPNYSCRKFFLTKDLVKALETAKGDKSSTERVMNLTLTESEIESLVHMTMNFSGASMKKLTMRLFLLMKNTWAKSASVIPSSKRTADLLATVLGVCDQMRVTVSGVRLPSVINASGGRNFTSPFARGQLMCPQFLQRSTRRILVDARDTGSLKQLILTVEEWDKNSGRFTTRTLPLRPKCKVEKCGKFAAARGSCRDGGDCNWMTDLSTATLLTGSAASDNAALTTEIDVALVPDVLRELVFFADEIGLSNFTLLDRQYLQEKGCYDETKALEELQSVFRERKFAPSLVLMDLDSLGGVSVSQSTGSMGSLSYSVSYPHIVSAALAEFRRGRVVEVGGEVLDPYWIVAYVGSEVVFKTFEDVVHWPSTKVQEEKKKRDEVDCTCTACGQRFKEKDNKPDACKYHPGSIISSSNGEQVIVPGPLEEEFDGDVTLLGIDDEEKDEGAENEEKKKKPYFIYSCCGQRPGSGGCHSKKHSTGRFRRTLMSFGPPAKGGTTVYLEDDVIVLSAAFLTRLPKEWKMSQLGKDAAQCDMPDVLPRQKEEKGKEKQRMKLSKSVFDEYIVPLIEGRAVPTARGKVRTAYAQMLSIGIPETFLCAAKVKYPQILWRGDQYGLRFEIDEEKMIHTAKCHVEVNLELEAPETDEWCVELDPKQSIKVCAVVGGVASEKKEIVHKITITKKEGKLTVDSQPGVPCLKGQSETIRILMGEKGGTEEKSVSVKTRKPPFT